MKKGKITYEEVKDLIPECEEKHSELYGKFDQDEDFYELNFKELLKIPKEFESEGIVLPTSRDMVDTYVDHIDLSNPRVLVNKKSTSDISAERAEMMRKFYLGVNYAVNVQSDIAPARVGGKHYALHGLTIIKDVWSADKWLDKPKQKEGESEDKYAERIDEWRATSTPQSLPISVEAVHPRCILADPSYGDRGFVIERHKKICFNVKKKWHLWSNPKGKQLSEDVDYDVYFDEEYRCDLIDGEPVLRVSSGVAKHGYGFLPYVFIDSGMGNISKDAKLEMRYVGILRYMIDLLISESRDFSISDIVLAKTAWPWGYLTGDNAGMVDKITQTFGSYSKLPEGVELHQVSPEVPPDALNLHLARVSDYIAAHAAPRSVRGLSEIGVRSWADRRGVIAEAAAKYRYSKDAFKHGWARVLINCAKLYKNVIPGNTFTLALTPTDEFDVVIDKDKMEEPFNCYVEFAPISEEDEYRRHDDLERLINTGVVTRRWARQQMSNVDPLALELEEEKEKIKIDPNFMAAKSQYATGKLMAALSQREGAEAIAGGGMPPAPPGTPREMGTAFPDLSRRAVPGSAEDIQNQLEKQRSQSPLFPGQGQGGGGAR